MRKKTETAPKFTRIAPALAAATAFFVLAGCGDKYDRLTSRMISDSYRAKGSISLNTLAAPAVELYYIQRYGANALQKKTAEETAHRYLMNRRARAPIQNAHPVSGAFNAKYAASRYVAVDVPRIATSKGAASVMVFDTQSRQIVGNTVYDLEVRPKAKQPIIYDSHPAQYIGDGSTAE